MTLLQQPLRLFFQTVEGWLDRVFTPAWNPFHHFGALGFFYYWIVAVSGVYIYIFFDTSTTEAYATVEYLTHDQWYLGGVMRSLHRYASDGLVLMMAVHIVREFAYDRYRGARWYTWVTGVPPMFAMAFMEKDLMESVDLSSVSLIRMGSAPISLKLWNKVRSTFPGADTLNVYGTTEAGPIVFGPAPGWATR